MNDHQFQQQSSSVPGRKVDNLQKNNLKDNVQQNSDRAGFNPKPTPLTEAFSSLGKNPPTSPLQKAAADLGKNPPKTSLSEAMQMFKANYQSPSPTLPAQAMVDKDAEDEEKIQMKEGESSVSAAAGSTGSLPGSVLGKMEGAFGVSFSDVKVHNNSSKASDMRALAFAQGNDIHFAPGQYNPDSKAGQNLIGHELTHVVQQRQGRVKATTQAKGVAVNDDPALEQEADEMGRKAADEKDVQIENSTAFTIQKAGNPEEGDPWNEVEDDALYVVSNARPLLREYVDKEFKATETLITRWSEVNITKESLDGKYVYIVKAEDSSEIGWTSKSNLYSTDWDPENMKDEYKKISTAYSDQMLANDPSDTWEDLALSGSDTKATIDKYFKNSNDVDDLDSDFKTKYENLVKCFEDNDMTVEATAGLRHPLRSLVFNYAIKVRDAADINIIQEANAVCKKYGVPIDWAHKTEDGDIDLQKSKDQAKVVCKAFGLGKAAARGVKDFRGTISNHNSGKAVDVSVTLGFSEKKEITYDNEVFTVDPEIENKSNIPNIESSGLTLLGKKASGLQRKIKNDPVHWSLTGR